MYVNTSNMDVYDSHAGFRHAFPRVSFPATITEGLMASFGVRPLVADSKPTHDEFTQTVAQGTPTLDGDTWRLPYVVSDLSADDQAAYLANWRATTVVTKRQALRALLTAGITEEMVDSAVDALPSNQAEAKIDWKHSTEVRRASPLVPLIQPTWNLTDSQVDDLFKVAKAIE